jgi:hypothetical protein
VSIHPGAKTEPEFINTSAATDVGSVIADR